VLNKASCKPSVILQAVPSMKESLSRFTLKDIALSAYFEDSSLLYLYMNALMIRRALDNTTITDHSFPINSIMDNIIMQQKNALCYGLSQYRTRDATAGCETYQLVVLNTRI
jgi:hypothetical protein